MKKVFFLTFLIAFGPYAHQANGVGGNSVFLMPMTCAELLPDPTPYTSYLEAIAKGASSKDRGFSRRIYRVLAMRQKLAENDDRAREQNPIDILIRRTVCYYREQKDPLRQIPFDDADFLKFLQGSLKDLEQKVDEAVFQMEYERAQRKYFEAQLEKTASAAQKIKDEAESSADQTYDRLSKSAKKKAGSP